MEYVHSLENYNGITKTGRNMEKSRGLMLCCIIETGLQSEWVCRWVMMMR